MPSADYALTLARQMEDRVRSHGAVPAHICLLDGKACVGLSSAQLEQMAAANGSSNVMKISRRDLAYALATTAPNGSAWVGGTTIAGTSVLANMAGIKVFATGGLGGVHRGAEVTMDVSADLTELGRTAIAVIASGCKSFLDAEKTLEYLETEGVYVATFGDQWSKGEYKDVAKEVEFPGFYTRKSGVKSPSYVDSSEAAAKMICECSGYRSETWVWTRDANELIDKSHQLGLTSGQFFANPVPQDYSLPSEKINEAIAKVVEETNRLKVPGNQVTPIILSEIKKFAAAQGLDTLKANTALLLNNAVRGAEVASHLSKLENGQ